MSSDDERSQHTDDEQLDDELSEEDKKSQEYIPYLAHRACHIPGHSWARDWYQHVIANNHCVFGLFLAYKFHPVTLAERIFVLLASVAASIVISEGFYIIWLIKEGGYVSYDADTPIWNSYKGYKIAVYTIGAIVHTIFDLSIWAIAGCSCAEPGGMVDKLNKKTKTSPLIVFGIFCGTTCLAVLLWLLYETIDNGKTGDDKDADTNYTLAILDEGFDGIDWDTATSRVGSEEENDKWMSWFTHFLMYVFIYDLAFATIFFSGILNCGCSKIPILGTLLGGRPLELKEEEEEAAEKKRSKKKRKKRKKKRRGSADTVESIAESIVSEV